MKKIIDLSKDFKLVDDDQKREVPFCFIDDPLAPFTGSLAKQMDIVDGFVNYAVCPLVFRKETFEQREFLNVLESGTDEAFNAFCSWFKKNSFLTLRRSLVSGRWGVCLK